MPIDRPTSVAATDRPILVRLAVALLAVIAATLGYWLLEPLLAGKLTYILYFPAVLVAAWFGRLAAGLAATLLAAAAAYFFFVAPALTLGSPAVADALGSGLFIIMGSLISLLVESLHRARQRAARARAEAEMASRAKDEFLALISHELRTPLNAIVTWGQLLATAQGHELLDQGLEAIDRNVKLQLELINQLLDLSRLVSGKLALERRPVAVSTVVDQAIDGMQALAAQREIEITLSTAEGGAVLGDAARLRQVVSNLLRNAVKFTPEGGTVRVEVAGGPRAVEIGVEDSGVGIERDFLPYVFDPFRQLDASSRRRYGGLGVGLALVRQLVELHGGQVRAESEGPGRGARFIVTLPRCELTEAAGEAAPALDRDLSGIRVLVVEDDADARETMRLALRHAGAEVETATCGREALSVWQRGSFDVLLSDLGLPEIDGYELLSQLRQGSGEVTAAAVTAFVSPEDRQRARQAGFDAFLPKPLALGALLETVHELAQGDGHNGNGAAAG